MLYPDDSALQSTNIDCELGVHASSTVRRAWNTFLEHFIELWLLNRKSTTRRIALLYV